MRMKFTCAALAMGTACLFALDSSPAKALILTTGQASTGAPYGGYVCADVSGNSLNSPTNVQAWDCNGAPNQQFEWYALTIYTEGAQRCLDVFAGKTSPGSKVDSATCNGTRAQLWYYTGGQIVNDNGNPNLCLDAGNAQNGTQLVINRCNGSASQQWQLK